MILYDSGTMELHYISLGVSVGAQASGGNISILLKLIPISTVVWKTHSCFQGRAESNLSKVHH